MKDEMEKFLKNKKNRKILFFLLGAILLYFYVKKKDTAKTENVGYAGLKYTNGGVPTTGSGTKPVVNPPVVTIPNTNSNSRRIFINTTGYGFSTDAPTGIHPNWVEIIEGFRNLNYNGSAFSGIDGVTLNVKWSDYEPTVGVYNDAALRRAITWCRDRNLIFNVCFWALRDKTDNYLPKSDRATGSNPAGDNEANIFETEYKYTLALNSAIGKARIFDTCKHMAQVMKEYSNCYMIRPAIGHTEEFYPPIIQSFNATTREIKNVSLTGYSAVDRAAWATYAANHGIAGTPPPVSPDANNAWTTGDLWNTTNGRHWYEFITDSTASVFAAFRDGIKAGGMKVCGCFADAGAAQSAWYYSFHLNRIFAGSDIIYSSDGGTIYDSERKQLAADLAFGTFGKDVAIEADQQDIALDGAHYSYGDPVSDERLHTIFRKAFDRGVNICHLSMAFKPSTIPQMTYALYRLRTQVLNNPNFATSTPQGTPISYTINSLSGDAGYNAQWFAAGGGLDKQVKIALS